MFYLINVIQIQWTTMVIISGLYSHTQKSSEWLHLCSMCMKKRDKWHHGICCGQVSKSVMVTAGVSNVGKQIWYLTILEWRSMVLLTQKLLAVKRSVELLLLTAHVRQTICNEAPAFIPSDLCNEAPAFIPSDLWPQQPRSEPEYKRWGAMQQWMYQRKDHDINELKQQLIDVWHGF